MAAAKSTFHRAPWWRGENAAESASVEAAPTENAEDPASIGAVRKESDKKSVSIVSSLTRTEIASVREWPELTVANLKEQVALPAETPACYIQLCTSDGGFLEDSQTLATVGDTVLLTRLCPSSPIEDFYALCKEPADSEVLASHAQFLLDCISEKEWNPNIRNPYEVNVQGYIFEPEEDTGYTYDPNPVFTNEDGTLLTRVASLGHTSICLALLNDARLTESGMVDGNGVTALMHAAYHNKSDVSLLLLGHNRFSDVNAVNHLGSALHYALWPNPWEQFHASGTSNAASVALAILRASRFEAVNAKDGRGQTALHMAAQRGFAEVCRILMQDTRFVEVNSVCRCLQVWPSYYGNAYVPLHRQENATALHFAAAHSQPDTCREILKNERFTAIDVRTSSRGLHAIHLAVANPRPLAPDTFSALEDDPRVDVHAKDASGRTIFHVVVQFAATGSYNQDFGNPDAGYADDYEKLLTRMWNSTRFDHPSLCRDFPDEFSSDFTVVLFFESFLGWPIIKISSALTGLTLARLGIQDPRSSKKDGCDALDVSVREMLDELPRQRQIQEEHRKKATLRAQRRKDHLTMKQLRELRERGRVKHTHGCCHRGPLVERKHQKEEFTDLATQRNEVAGTGKLVQKAYTMDLPDDEEEDG